MSDVAYVVLTIGLFAVLALVLRGLEGLLAEPGAPERGERSSRGRSGA